MLSSRSQPAERSFFTADGSPVRAPSRGGGQHEASRLLGVAAAVAPRAPDMPQTAPDMPQIQAVEAGDIPRMACAVSQSFSSDELGSSVETSAGGKRHRRRRPWCVVCMACPQEVAIDPCGHLSMCHRCATAVEACPVCRGPIEKALRVYIA
mmetsp:Transcript_1519/g.5175  ORF Transcript_1519/g.5175 Transcript_1519/m.5175 type:complete len:152 (-) Transcript_1519:247-702(-)